MRRTVVGLLALGFLTLGFVALASCAAPPAGRIALAPQEPVARLALPADVAAGALASFDATASLDVDGALTGAWLDFGDGTPPEARAADVAAWLFEHRYPSAGRYVVQLEVTDDQGLVGRARMPLVVGPGMAAEGEGEGEGEGEDPLDPEEPDPEADRDGDGLPDLQDPAPDVKNGLTAELFLLEELFEEGIPTDLLGNQRAERVVSALAEASPAFTNTVFAGFLEQAPSDDVLAALFPAELFPAAPDASGGFVLRFSGYLDAPAGADALRVEIGADDVGVVLLDGTPVASADEEFARDFLRFDRVPADSEEIALAGRPWLELIVANGEGLAAWDVRLSLLSQGVNVMVPEAVGARQFTVR